MFGPVDEIALKHHNAPSNLNVEEVEILLKTIYDNEIHEHDQYMITRKYREALEDIHGLVVNADDHASTQVREIANKALDSDD